MSDVPFDDNPGQPIARRPNPFGGNGQLVAQPAQPLGALASTEQQRALGELQAQVMMARLYPRDRREVTEQILNDCTRVELAQEAQYDYVRGGQRVTGPSIRLMEAIARRWGNIQSGIAEVSRDRERGISECLAYCWDVETGFRDERKFQVFHLRDRSEARGGQQKLTDERSIYELVANMGQRRKRACLEAVIPSEVTEAAVAQCNDTLQQKEDVTLEGRKKLLAAFTRYGVTQAHIEAFCQCRLEAIRPAQIVRLRSIFTSLKDGEGTPDIWFKGWQPPARPTRQPQAPAESTPAPEPPVPPEPPVAETSQEQTTDNMSGFDDVPDTGAEFAHVVMDQRGEPVDGEIILDPLAWAQAFLDTWTRAGDRENLLHHNADALADAKAASPEADALLDGLEQPPAPSEPDEDERLSSEILQRLPTITTGNELIAYSKTPAVLGTIQRWQREGRAGLVTSVKSAFTARLSALRQETGGA